MTSIHSSNFLNSTPSIAESIHSDVSIDTSCSYDKVPYASHPVAASHPDRLYGVAKLFGLNPILPENARILELGCAGGGNLLPIASQFPNATCVGVELSKVQVEDARIASKFVGLPNVTILHGSITDITKELGVFDYILCHGVYSWVPDEVREAILRVSSENLSENGVAYISYNTQPGWYLRGMVRDMMLRHVEGVQDAATKIEQARAFLRFLVDSNQHEATPYSSCLHAEASFLDKQPDLYLFHEHLEDYNKAFFFQDFIKDASRHGLQFLGESNLSTTWIGNLSPEAKDKLQHVQDAIQAGHYVDCVAGRMFRETLLVHKKQNVSRHLDTNRLQDIQFLGRFESTENPCDRGPSHAHGETGIAKSYKTSANKILTTSQPSCQITIERLADAYPCSLTIEQLIESVQSATVTLGENGEKTLPFSQQELGVTLMEWALAGHIEFRFLKDRATTQTNGKPQVCSWARSQARAGKLVTNLRHEMIALPKVQRRIIPLLDGSRNVHSIIAEIESLIRTGVLVVESENAKHECTSRDHAIQIAKQTLQQLAGFALLMAK